MFVVKRVLVFKGKDLIDTLLSDGFNERKSKLQNPLTCTSEQAAILLANKLIRKSSLARIAYSKDDREKDLYKFFLDIQS